VTGDDFVEQCEELGREITDLLFSYPKPVVVVVLPGIMASVAKSLDIRRDKVIAMFDAALEGIGEA
jgi:hypothetical protein